MAVNDNSLRVPSSDPIPHRILVVDDDEDAVAIIQMFFAKRGYSIDVARDGHAALLLLKEHRHDLVLSDVMMPVMDGYRFCEHVRSDPDISLTPIILITAKSEPASKVLGLEKGADDYLVKPINLFELSARVEATLRNRKLREDLLNREKELDRIRTLEQTLAVISHHINNAIAPIYGRAQLTRPDDPVQVRKLVEAALDGCQRVTKTLRVLSQVIEAMKQPANAERFDLVDHSLKDIALHINAKVAE